MDQLSPAEKAEVESHLVTYPELRNDLKEIERTLEIYAGSAGIKSPAGVREKILEAIKNDTRGGSETKIRSSGFWPIAAAIFGFGILVLGYLLYQKDLGAKQLERDIALVRDTCQTRTNDLTRQLDLLRQLTEPNNKILPFTATPGFASTDLYFHTNKVTKRNFIQVRSLPAKSPNQIYELWSLKTGQAPARMDLFDVPSTGLVEVQYVEGTEIYAITIEQAGGVDSPTMANLIGTVAVGGQ